MSFNQEIFHCIYACEIICIVLIMLQVSLGKTNDLLAADYSADQLPKGKHSTKGLGRVEPDPAQSHTL